MLENLLQNFRFAHQINYAKQTLTTNTKEITTLALLDTSLSEQKFAKTIENNIIQLTFVNIRLLKCNQDPPKPTIDTLKLFTIHLTKQNKLQIDIINFESYVSTFRNCTTFELMLTLNYSSSIGLLTLGNSNTASTLLRVKIENLHEFTLKKSFEDANFMSLNHTYSLISTRGSTLSINVYDLIKFNVHSRHKVVVFKAFALTSNILDFYLNTLNGILLVNLSSDGGGGGVVARFEIVCFGQISENEMGLVFLKKFFINISDRVQYYYFVSDFSSFIAAKSFDLNQMLNTFSLATNKPSFFLLENNSTLFTLNHDRISLRAKNFVFYPSFRRLLNMSVCLSIDKNSCDYTELLINVKQSNPLNLPTLYQRITLTSNRRVQNEIALTKLSSNSNYTNFFAGMSLKNSIYINELNGVVYLRGQNYSAENISIIEDTKPKLVIELIIKNYDDNKLPVLKARTNLRVDFYMSKNASRNVAYFMGNIGPSPLDVARYKVKCELWNFYEASFELDENCDLYLLINPHNIEFSNKQINLQIRAYYAHAQLQRDYVYYNVEVNLNELKLTPENTQMYQIEFGRPLSMADILYNYLRINLNSHLIDVTGSVVTILTALNLETLQLKLRHLESDLKLNILSVSNEPIKASEFVAMPSRLINTNEFILACVSGIKIPLPLPVNVVSFEKLNFLKYEAFNFEYEKILAIKFLFKFKDMKSQKGQFLFQASVTLNNVTFLMGSLIDQNLRFKFWQNLTNESFNFKDEIKLEMHTWYVVQIQVFNSRLDVGLQKQKEATVFGSLNFRDSTINAAAAKLEINYLFIGGLDLEHAKMSESIFASDNLQMAEFKVNHYELFDEQVMNDRKALKLWTLPTLSGIGDEKCNYLSEIIAVNCDEGKN
jgi:hypothetical protein